MADSLDVVIAKRLLDRLKVVGLCSGGSRQVRAAGGGQSDDW
jgi:hypothetical protein